MGNHFVSMLSETAGRMLDGTGVALMTDIVLRDCIFPLCEIYRIFHGSAEIWILCSSDTNDISRVRIP